MDNLEEKVQRLMFQMETMKVEIERLEAKVDALETCLKKDTQAIRGDISLLMTTDEFKEEAKSFLRLEVFTALFTPIQRAYYGGIVLLALAVGGAILNLVIKK